jgi:hypothetical protein
MKFFIEEIVLVLVKLSDQSFTANDVIACTLEQL